MTIDHVAVPARNIARSVEWYVQKFNAEVLYQDATWAFLKFGNCKLALVTPTQHPPHVAITLTQEELMQRSNDTGIPIDTHRDGTQGFYINDPDGNAIEYISYPPGGTVYAGAAKKG
jgi:catechol 2,3-dioxygenase-like lactoylglutathione lyase family enzyme